MELKCELVDNQVPKESQNQPLVTLLPKGEFEKLKKAKINDMRRYHNPLLKLSLTCHYIYIYIYISLVRSSVAHVRLNISNMPMPGELLKVEKAIQQKTDDVTALWASCINTVCISFNTCLFKLFFNFIQVSNLIKKRKEEGNDFVDQYITSFYETL